MKITCQSCSAKYTIADEKVQGKVAKIRCRKCGETIVVNGQGAAEGAAAMATTAPLQDVDTDGDITYTVSVAEDDQRPMAPVEIARAYASGLINLETYVWTDGMEDWLALGEIPALAKLVEKASVPVAAAAKPTAASASASASASAGAGLFAVTPTPFTAVAAATTPVQIPMATPTPAARRDGVRNRVDLFGTPTQPEEEDEPTRIGSPAALMSLANEEPDARARQQPQYQPQYQPQQPSSAHSDATSMTGARNEQSVLFSLNALVQSEQKAKPSRSNDDSGLIDLAALAKAAESTGSNASAPLPMNPMMGGSVLGGPVLGGSLLQAPPLGAAGFSVPPPPAKNKLGLYLILASILLAAGGIIMAIILTSKKDDADPTAATAPSAIAAPVPTETTPAPTSTAVDPTQTAATAAATKDPAPTVLKRSTGGGAKPSTGGAAAPPDTPKAADPPKPASPSNNCGCPPGDLNCAIKCSSTKKK